MPDIPLMYVSYSGVFGIFAAVWARTVVKDITESIDYFGQEDLVYVSTSISASEPDR
jgi:drug/metabolite transporter superfamily protein YnfA